MDFPREALAVVLASLASEGVYLGTSSWKYEGWVGLLYTRARYETRGKFSAAKFQKTCLAEYAEVFKTVCFDGGYYRFPTREIIEGYLSQVPSDFRLTLKVPEDITVKRFANVRENGERAGQINEHFLDAELFVSNLLGTLEPYRSQIGTLILEFSHFHPGDFERGLQFVEALDQFLTRLPRGWNYSVEIRNENFLQPEYFEVLRRHGVAHAFNSWARMPSVAEQIRLPNSFTADFATARFLLKPGRGYQQAVDTFSPYSEIKEPNPDARAALIDLVLTPAKPGRPGRRFLYVNNRLEGCALWTIYAALAGLLTQQSKDGTIRIT